MSCTRLIALSIMVLAACSSVPGQTLRDLPSGGSGGSVEAGSGQGGDGVDAGSPAYGEAGSSGQGGIAGSPDAGSAGITDAGAAGQGGIAGSEDVGNAGQGGEADGCELPGYLQASRLMNPGVGRPVIPDVVPTVEAGVTPQGGVLYGTVVRYSKYDSWRCEHRPSCEYSVQVPSHDLAPFTERYWQPVYWQGGPPDGKTGEWVGECTLGQWRPHGTCGGFFKAGDYVNYSDPTDEFAERFLWQCRPGWETVCDTHIPGASPAWQNMSLTDHCYGYVGP